MDSNSAVIPSPVSSTLVLKPHSVDPTDAPNYRGEQAIRPAVVNRKVWGGNRTWLGARWQSILTSILRTCEQRAVQSFEFLAKALCNPTHQLLIA